MALVAFIGGLSAATAMVIVESVALAIMVSNDIVVPLVLKRRATQRRRAERCRRAASDRRAASPSLSSCSSPTSTIAPPATRSSPRSACFSFAAIAQFAPAFFGGLMWRRGTARGAIAGMSAGILVWGYTLLLPSISDAGMVGARILADGPFGLALLRPQALFGIDLPPLVHGVCSASPSTSPAISPARSPRRPTAIERVQADVFVPSTLAPDARRASGCGALRSRSRSSRRPSPAISATNARANRSRASPPRAASRLEPQAEADFQLLQYGEYLLASAIGAASSRLVLSLLLRKRTLSTKAALKLLDDANAAIHYNREILQTALDHVRQGIAVFDKELRAGLLEPAVRRNLRSAARAHPRRHRARRNPPPHRRAKRARRPAIVDRHWSPTRIARYTSEDEPFLERFAERGLVIEVRANRMPDGGLVTTFTDITPSVKAAEALERANATLERRVRERTGELTRLNTELERAKAEADDANVSKTRFIAAASHDILQPLNAARLYVTSLIERQRAGEDADLVAQHRRLARGGRGDIRRAARHFAARHRRDEAGTGRFPHRRIAAAAGSGIRAAGARERSRPRLHALLAHGALRPPAAAAPAAEPGFQRDQIHAGGPRAGRLPAPRLAPAHRRLRHRHRHSAGEAARRVQGVPPPRPGRARGARRRPRTVDRRAHRPRARLRGRAEIEYRPRLALLGRSAPRDGRLLPRPRAQRRKSTPAGSLARSCSASTTSRAILDGMETLLGGWGCRVLKAADLAERTGGDRRERHRARRASRRLPPRRRQRRRRHRRPSPPPAAATCRRS